MDYLDLLTHLPNVSIWGVISVFFLILTRLVPIMIMAPFLGAKLAPGIARMGLTIALTIIFLPFVSVKLTAPVLFDCAFIGYALKELLIGFFLGFMIAIPFYTVQSSGIFIDYLRGASIMQAQDPSMQTQASSIGILYNYILIVIFFQVSAPFIFFDAILLSFDVVPVNHYINPAFFAPNSPFWENGVDIMNQIVTIAIQLASPSIVAILMAEMFLGIANRLSPQVQIAFLGMSIKSLLGLALLWAAWFFILKQFSKHSYDWVEMVNRIIYYMRV